MRVTRRIVVGGLMALLPAAGAQAQGNQAGGTAVPTVTFERTVEELKSADSGLRLRAVQALRQAGYPEAAVPLAGAVLDEQDAVQYEAIAAELNLFLAEKIVPRRRVGGIVEVRNSTSAVAIFELSPGGLVPQPVPMDVLTAL